ncbi:dihydrodipicolinate synthase family protein [Caulobacter segnis]|uniref:dihydrodipicolinate synthase family protein n=1 Tax=Caulobacter segnis TaxID=88688 RepID=UPI0024107F73|nr:dihydrodipicolinate synthase family protein [Caulobacter segnis]MDG2520152.1 dihydrodipicolinate synthase family protein [Caulobacter segnis]
MTLFSGLSAFPITPADAEGRVDAAGVQRVVGRLVEARVDSIGLLGSTGTYAYLTRDERRRAVEAAVERVQGSVPIMVGIGATSTAEVIRLGQDAAKAGADAVLLAPVSYLPLTDAEVAGHYTAVAAAVGLPLCIYNNPTVTRFTFSPELISRLSQMEGIAAVKTSGAATPQEAEALVSELRARVAPGFSIGCAADWLVTEAMIAGAQAWYSVLGGLFPAPIQTIVRAVQAGDFDTARAENARLKPLWGLFQELTSFRVIYAANALLGLSDAQPPRPILGLSETDRRRVEQVIEQLELA